MVPKLKKIIPLDIPAKMDDVDSWLVVGLDPSLSRTGYAIMYVDPRVEGEKPAAFWQDVGSVKPSEASKPIWIRGKAMSVYLRETISKNFKLIGSPARTGLIISMEFPTPRNDFLVALNRIIHLVFFEGDFYKQFAAIRIMTVNPASMRSLMGLTMQGSKNKKENIVRAYEYISRQRWPSLDTDSCDAVLHAIIAKHAASIMLGLPESVPERFKNSLCNSNKEVKGKGTRVRIITKGLLHRDEYWYPYNREEYTLLVKDAANPKPGLKRENFTL
jgi:hypothetical protein